MPELNVPVLAVSVWVVSHSSLLVLRTQAKAQKLLGMAASPQCFFFFCRGGQRYFVSNHLGATVSMPAKIAHRHYCQGLVVVSKAMKLCDPSPHFSVQKNGAPGTVFTVIRSRQVGPGRTVAPHMSSGVVPCSMYSVQCVMSLVEAPGNGRDGSPPAAPWPRLELDALRGLRQARTGTRLPSRCPSRLSTPALADAPSTAAARILAGAFQR